MLVQASLQPCSPAIRFLGGGWTTDAFELSNVGEEDVQKDFVRSFGSLALLGTPWILKPVLINVQRLLIPGMVLFLLCDKRVIPGNLVGAMKE